MTLSGLLREGRERLKSAGIPEWDLDAWYLLEYAADCTRNEYFLYPEKEVSPSGEQLYRALIRKRSAHIPLQYLTGRQEFMGFSFVVNEKVLIPRQDTEILVEEALRTLDAGMRVLDVCTGSGCILLSLMRLCAGLEGTGTDLSEEALQVAGENARRLGARVSFVQGDLFEPVSGKYDCIVSNPPYIASREVDALMEEVRGHEPRMALDGGEDGEYFYRKMAVQRQKYVKERERKFAEVGFDQGEAVAGLLAPAFDEVRIVQDLAGLDRVVCGILRS